MNSKIKKAGLVVSIIVVIILVDLLFNLSGVLSEKFQNSGNNNNSEMEQKYNNAVNKAIANANGVEYSQENVDRNSQIIRSIESIFSTARYNVVALPYNAKHSSNFINKH